MKNFSQNDEQRVILDYFGEFKGTFCDLGANDGVTFSNTYALSLLGWDGALIEASPKAYKRIKAVGPGIEIYSAAIGAKNEKRVFNQSGALVSKNDVALVSSFHQSEVDRFKKSVDYEPIEIQCITWADFLQLTCFDRFDFISMDIEGSELEVLPQMDLSEVKLFCIEWNSKPELKAAYEPYFEGFKLIHTTGENLIYGR
jgi:FkbM family methyltransferase